MRTLPLLGLVLLMAVVASAGVAQDASTYTAFPFLSPRTDQTNMLANAFAFQMQLFAGISGMEGELSAVRILAMLAVLVGAMMIIFFPKYQKMPTILTWLLLVVIVLFVPLGSQLVFYPIKVIKARMIQYNDRPTPVQNGQPCDGNFAGCGFTPQLAAVHIGSVMQVVASDVFRSAGWGDLLNRQTAATELYTKPDFNLGRAWYEKNRDYAGCNDDLSTLVNGPAPTDQVGTPMLLMTMWNSLDKYFNDPNGRFDAPPPVIVFPTQPSYVKDTLKWNSDIIEEYEAGVTALCGTFCKESGDAPIVRLEKGDAGSISVEEAFASMREANPYLFGFKKDNGTGIAAIWRDIKDRYMTGIDGDKPLNGPGIYFATDTDLDVDGYMQSRSCYVPLKASQWGAVIPGLEIELEKDNVSTEWCLKNKVGQLGVDERFLYDPQFHATTYNYMNKYYFHNPSADKGVDFDSLPPPWNRLASLMMAVPAVTKMPVAYGRIEPVDRSTGAADKYAAPKVTPTNPPTCYQRGKDIIDTAINSLNDKQAKPYFDNLVKMLQPNGVIPDNRDNGTGFGRRPYVLEWSDITSEKEADVRGDNPEKWQLVEHVRIRMNEAMRMVDLEKAGDNPDNALRAAMVNSLVELMQRVTMQSANIQENDFSSNAAKDGTNMLAKLVGIDVVTDVGGNAAVFFGKIIAKIGAWFTGPLAAAFIQFLTVLVDFTLMVLITITPLLFVFGLLIPSAAAGVMTIAVMSVLILKFVPVTLIIMNGVGGMIYDLLPASVGINAGFTRDLLVLAMGGLYMNIVGLTFFLMFKLGDPAAFLGRLTALDGTAKQLADRGMAATKAAAGIAATAALGYLWGGAGGAALKMRSRQLGSALGLPDELTTAAVDLASKQSSAETKGSPAGAKGNATERALPPGMSAEEYDALTPEQRALLDDPEMGAFTDRARRLHGLTAEETAQMVKNGYIDKDGKRYSHSVNASSGAWGLGVSESPRPLPTGRDDEQEAIFNSIDNKELAPVASDVATRAGQTKEEAKAAENATLDKLTTPTPKEGTPATGGTTVVSGGNVTAASGGIAQVTVVGGKLDDVGQIGRMASVQGTSVQERVANKESEKTADDALALRDNIRAAMDENPELRKELEPYLDRASAVMSPTELKDLKQEIDEKVLSKENTTLRKTAADEQARINMNQQLGDKLTAMENLPAFKAMQAKQASGEELNDVEKKLKNAYENLSKPDTAGLAQADMAMRLAHAGRLQQALEARGMADKTPGILRSADSGLYGALSGAGGGLAKIPVIGPAIAEALNEFNQAPERARAWQMVGGKTEWKAKQRDAARMGFFQKEVSPLVAADQYDSMVMRGGFQAQYEVAAQAAREAVEKTRAQYEAMNASRKSIMEPALTQLVMADSGFMNGVNKLPENKRQEKISLEVGKRFNDMLQGNTSVAKDLKLQMEHTVRASDQYKDIPAYNVTARMDMLTNGVAAQMDAMGIGANGNLRVSMSANELVGIGRIDAADRIASVRQEAFVMQSPSLVVQAAKYGLDGNMLFKKDKDGNLLTETEDVSLVLTPDLLSKFRGDITNKKQAKVIDTMMSDHYALAEKQYLRGDADWNATRDMTRSKGAASMFVRKDVSTDYLVGAHTTMVSGKERFSESKGQYEMMVKFRHEDNKKLSEEIQRAFKGGSEQMKAVFKEAKLDTNLNVNSISQLSVDQRNKMESWAKKQLTERKELMPLNAIFDEAYTTSKAKYQAKAEVAMYNAAAQADEVYGKWQKAAASAYSSALPNAQDFTRKIRIDNNGVVTELGQANQRLVERFRNASGDKFFTQVDKIVMDVFKDHPQAVKVKIDGPKNAKEATMSVTGEAMKAIKEAILQKIGGEDAARIIEKLDANRDNKTFKTDAATGDAIFGKINKNGQIEQ